MDELEMIRRKKMLELMKKAGMIEVKPKEPKVVIEVITSPTCPYCPIAWSMAQEIARKYVGRDSKGSERCDSRRAEKGYGTQHNGNTNDLNKQPC